MKDNTDALDDLQFNPQKMSVLTNAVGALAECAKTKSNIYSIRYIYRSGFVNQEYKFESRK